MASTESSTITELDDGSKHHIAVLAVTSDDDDRSLELKSSKSVYQKYVPQIFTSVLVV